METNAYTLPSDLEKSTRSLPDFNNTGIAFTAMSNGDLRRAHWLFSMLGKQWVMKAGKQATMLALRLHLPIKWAVRKTIFKQFCGGETVAECAPTATRLHQYGIGSILDYSVEGKEAEADFEHTTREIIATFEAAKGKGYMPFGVFKVSGLCSTALLERASAGKLDVKDEHAFAELTARVDRICRKAAESGTPVFVDAEESWIQTAIDQLATEMMVRYNKDRAVVYNTVQLYRHDRLAFLKQAIGTAQANAYHYGVKLVRGAYMEKERSRAENRGYSSPIQPNKGATDRDFNAALEYCLDRVDRVAFCAGSHNEESNMKLAEGIDKRGIDRNDERVYAAQLFGMSDHISFNLSHSGYRVAKYLPYGPVREVMPYLIRRAEENTSVAGQTGRELRLIEDELSRRKAKGSRS